jgi:glucan phosphoethanolaminetransferase (alkaline phosphatase superfamily)
MSDEAKRWRWAAVKYFLTAVPFFGLAVITRRWGYAFIGAPLLLVGISLVVSSFILPGRYGTVSARAETQISPRRPRRSRMSRRVSIAALCTGLLCVGLCALVWLGARHGKSPEPAFFGIAGAGLLLVVLGVAGLANQRH